MSRSGRYRCEHCERFMTLVDGVLPLHADMDDRYCPGSDTEDYDEARSCICQHVNPPCSRCETNYVDHDHFEPGPLQCKNVKAADRCGLYCPLLVRAQCPTPEVLQSLAPQAAAEAPPLDLFEDLVELQTETVKPGTEPGWLTERAKTHKQLRGASTDA